MRDDGPCVTDPCIHASLNLLDFGLLKQLPCHIDRRVLGSKVKAYRVDATLVFQHCGEQMLPRMLLRMVAPACYVEHEFNFIPHLEPRASIDI